MDGNKFDQITKSLASGLSRRQMIKGAAGALGALVGLRHEADAAACRGIRHPCEGTQECCPGLGCVEASFEGQSERCCPPGQAGCGTGCCTIGQCCQQGNQQVCLAAGQCCTAATCPTPTNLCKVATCTAGVCGESNIANDTNCDDTNVCNGTQTCTGGVCGGGTPLDCSSFANACNTAACDPTTGCYAVPVANDTPCDDTDVCNGTQTCTGGVCGGGTPLDCSSFANACNTAACDPTTGCYAVPVANDTPCDDGLFCNGNETCQGGICTAGVN